MLTHPYFCTLFHLSNFQLYYVMRHECRDRALSLPRRRWLWCQTSSLATTTTVAGLHNFLVPSLNLIYLLLYFTTTVVTSNNNSFNPESGNTMAQRIERDPSLEVCPDFASPDFQPIREMLTQAGRSNEEAIQSLTDTWVTNNNNRKEIWHLQEEAEAAQRAEQQRLRDEQAEQERLRREEEAEQERIQAEKKKPKINDFDKSKAIDDTITPNPSPYAINKLSNFDYVELYYFTKEACAEAHLQSRSSVEDAFSLASSEDGLVLRSIAAAKPSRNVVLDRDLTWSQFGVAKNNYLRQISKLKWPPKHVEALTTFFFNLEIHEYRNKIKGDEALLSYACRSRREWHTKLKLNVGFNIGIINERLLRKAYDEIWDDRRERAISTVSQSCLYFLPRSLTNYSRYCHPSRYAPIAPIASIAPIAPIAPNAPTAPIAPTLLNASYTLQVEALHGSPPPSSSSTRQASKRGRRSRSRSPYRRQPRADHRSRSRSPRCKPNKLKAKSRDAHGQVFQSGADSTQPLPVWALCLSRRKHDIYRCNATQIWDGSKTWASRHRDNRLVDPDGNSLCMDFQRPNGCDLTTHDHKHRCSGCGKPNHGAQRCHRAQKT